MGTGGGEGLSAAIARVLHRLVRVRMVALPVTILLIAPVTTTAQTVVYALVVLLVWLPWSFLWSRWLLRSSVWVGWLTMGDVVLTNLGLAPLEANGWIVAQFGALIPIAAAGQLGDVRWARRVLVAALVVGALCSPIADLSTTTVVFILVGLAVCGHQLIEVVVSASRELEAAATAAGLDPGTGLATRGSLVRYLQAGLDHGHQVTVTIFRLRGLDELAAAFGRDHADQTLRALEPTLAGHRDTFIAVVDSWTIALAATRSADDSTMAERVDRHIAEMVQIPAFRELGGCAGWALGPADAEDASGLVRIAERAARTAADAGETHRRASADDAMSVARRLELLGALPSITSSPGFAVHFQPQIEVAGRRIVGVEALARWTHPRLGPVRPDEFIQLAEIAGLLPEITMEVLDRSIGQVAAWRAEGLDLTMSVNVSIVDLQRPQFRDRLLATWQRHGVEPSVLTLEVTETQTSLPAEIDGTLRALADAGVRFAIDDFGTGHSSLLRVRDLPVTELKVDRAFVGSMLDSSADEVIVATTMQLGRTLGLEIVAEGVEDEATLERLAEMGCDRAQGYLVSPAVPAHEVPELCRTWSGEPTVEEQAGAQKG